MSESAAWPVNEALEAWAAADPDLAALLDHGTAGFGWHGGLPPDKSPTPLVTVDGMEEDAFPIFGADAQENGRTVSAWSAKSQREAALVYGALRRRFDGARVPVTGFGTLRTDLRLITSTVDPEDGWHRMIAELRIWTVAEAPA